MITTWMLYALLVAALVAAAAAGLEAVFRQARLPVRWVWVGGMLLTLALVAVAPGRAPEPVTLPAATLVAGGGTVAPVARRAPTLAERALTAEATAMRWVQDALATLGGKVPEPLARSLLLLWVAGSVAGLGMIGSTHFRFRRRRRGWPASELQGRRVRVAPNVGPAVMGVTRPEIVVPRWFLQLDPSESRLVLAHEGEHIRARDPLLLTLAWAVAALLLWNPAVWWMLSRLRLAVELDCDARVLGRGADPRSYGSVLIDLAGRSSPLRVGMLALADPPSQLERRLLAMTYQRTRSAAASAGILGTLAMVALLAACAAELPTAAQIQQMDVADAEAAGSKIALLDDGNTVYKLDGVVVTREQALAIAGDKIASVHVVRGRVQGGSSEVGILTRKVAEPGQGSGEIVEMAVGSVRLRSVEGAPEGAVPALFIDGVRKVYDARTSPFDGVRPEDIESISVVKDAQKGVAIAGPDGANGVIVIRTKNGPVDGFDLGDAPASEPVGIRIRGSATLPRTPSGAQSVYFIDGVRSTEAAFRALDPQRVESVSVFKDANAVAKIGPEGANGVIEVKTKAVAP